MPDQTSKFCPEYLQGNCPLNDLIAENELLREKVDEQSQNIAQLEAVITKLTGADPHSPEDAKSKFKPSRRTRKRLKKNGQKKGHKGVTRPKPTHIDKFEKCKLKNCPDCGHELSDDDAYGHWDHIQEDIIPAKVETTCYQHYRYRCPHCRTRHDAPAQGDEIPNARVGPRTLLAAALYKEDYALPYAKIAQLFRQNCGIKITAGGLAQCLQRLSNRLQGELNALRAAIRASPFVHVDETGWRVDGVNHYLWVFTDKIHTLYRIADSRGSKIPKEELGEDYGGTVISDFYSAYSPLTSRKQKCHTHLTIELHEVGEKNNSVEFGWFKKRLKRLLSDSVRLKERREKYGETVFHNRLARLKERALELNDVEYTDPDSTRLAKRVAKHADELFTFVEQEEVDRDNNQAERNIRPNVVLRKKGGINRSQKGAKTHTTLMSLIVTCKQSEKEWFDYAKEALFNQRDGNNPVLMKSIELPKS